MPSHLFVQHPKLWVRVQVDFRDGQGPRLLQPDQRDPRKARSPKQLDEAKSWYANTYLRHLLPVRTFFLRKLAHWGEPRRFVEVAFEFLDTPLSELQKRCVGTAPSMTDHHSGCSRAFLLGIQ